jgi:hypothetical protein
VAGWFKAFGEQGFTLLFRERAGKRHIGGIKKMTSYRYYSNIDIEEKTAAKEKNNRYILYFLPPNKHTKRKRYVWKCVDKNSWEYWEYYCSDGYPGRWPATGPALVGLFMIWLLYRLLLDILSRLKEYFYPLAAKEKKSVNNQKLLRGAMRLPPGRRRQNQKEEELWHY